MYKEIEDCLLLNKSIKDNNLVKLTWGNASVLSENGKYIAIKPSGVDFAKLSYSEICIVELYTGKQISGKKPSVDTAIHLEIYKAFPEIKSIIHSSFKVCYLLGTSNETYSYSRNYTR